MTTEAFFRNEAAREVPCIWFRYTVGTSTDELIGGVEAPGNTMRAQFEQVLAHRHNVPRSDIHIIARVYR